MIRSQTIFTTTFFLWCLLPAGASAEACEITSSKELICNFNNVSGIEAIEELKAILAQRPGYFAETSAAHYLIRFYENEGLIEVDPQGAFDAYVSLMSSAQGDKYLMKALQLVLEGKVEVAPDNRQFLGFAAAHAHNLRMSGEFDKALEVARSVLGEGILPNGGNDFNIYGTVRQMALQEHFESQRLLDNWGGIPAEESELTIVAALEGDPRAQFVIGKLLIEGAMQRDLNLRRVTTRTGHLEGGPYDIARGVSFLEAASESGMEEATALLEEHRATTIARLESEAEAERQAEQAELAEQERIRVENERIAAEAFEASRALFASAPGPYQRAGTLEENLIEAGGDTLVRRFCQRASSRPEAAAALPVARFTFTNGRCILKALTGASATYFVSRVETLGCTGQICQIRIVLRCGFEGLLFAAECSDFNRDSSFGTASVQLSENNIGIQRLVLD